MTTSASPEVLLSRQSPALLAKFIDFAPAMMAMFDREMRYLAANRAWRTEYGLGDQPLLGRSHYDVFPNILERWKEVHRRCLAGAVEQHDEDGYVRADVTIRWLRWQFHPWRDERGDIGGIVFFSEDITQRVHATERLQQTIEAAPTGMLIIDGAGRVVLVNAQIEQMFGYPRVELLGQQVEMLLPERHRSQHPFSRQEFYGAPGARAMGRDRGVYGAHKDGSEIPVEIRLNPLNTSEGKFVLSSIVDLTERRRMEADLRESEARFRELGSQSHDVIWMIGLDPFRVLYVSPAVQSIWGLSPAQNYQDPSLWERFVHPEDRQRVLLAWEKARTPGDVAGFEQEYRIIRPDGSTSWLSDILAPFHDADGKVVGLSGVSRDITDRKRLEHLLLEAADRERRSLGHDLHDGLGQELTAIALHAAACASAARKSGHPAATEMALLEDMARRAIASCRSIASGLSPLAGYANHGLSDALRDMVQARRDVSGVELCFQAIPGAPLRLKPDASDHIFRIAQEAVTNAQKHANAKLINVTFEVQPTSIRLSVRDDGAGQVCPAGGSEGMGLRTMQYRANLIGARLSIGPGENGGTIVTCECPNPP